MYRLVPDPVVREQVAALPVEALDAYAAVLDNLVQSPWSGEPQHGDNPDGAVRRQAFGPEDAGQLVYLILEGQQEVHLLLVQWWA
ncbi:hypothetical protein EV188_101114 [Actinomycetospora succinea]|uniref:ParE-like toxin of type II ParDE toxin-antitoxin system n=1 Tax=Actinomycetospora succinea TaxID=663603 RepID=A0A4R6VQP6_9PSEU|nr:hypothetical protein [Actinomycetospora succinea]TDQ64866.1 hypothetical protein EV188_101114 [Actinomycetospora succinea]